MTEDVKPKEESSTRIYYDFETEPVKENGVKRHRVVLAYALKCCEKCSGNIPTRLFDPGDARPIREIIDSMKEQLLCDQCSPRSSQSPRNSRLQVFSCVGVGQRRVDVIGAFCRWLFSKANQGAVAIAHNARRCVNLKFNRF